MQTAAHPLQLLPDAGKLRLVHILDRKLDNRKRGLHLVHPLVDEAQMLLLLFFHCGKLLHGMAVVGMQQLLQGFGYGGFLYFLKGFIQ
ncbi:hypothetical protein D3C76_1612950 [compost metagenome]